VDLRVRQFSLVWLAPHCCGLPRGLPYRFRTALLFCKAQICGINGLPGHFQDGHWRAEVGRCSVEVRWAGLRQHVSCEALHLWAIANWAWLLVRALVGVIGDQAWFAPRWSFRVLQMHLSFCRTNEIPIPKPAATKISN
jgi:hypothetical protein